MKPFPRTEFGDPILRAKSRGVSLSVVKKPGFKKLLTQMFFTMRHADGVGLAAPQVGLPLQLAVIQVADSRLRVAGKKRRATRRAGEKIVIINPKIIWKSKEKAYDWEGCLSFMDARGLVSRHRKIKVKYVDEKGIARERTVSGFLARVFQHEIDHLQGTLYIDRMDDMKTLMTLGEYRKQVVRT